MSVISVDLAGSARQFSPIVWRGCEMSSLTDKGIGYFIREDFQGAAKMVQNTSAGSFTLGSDLGGSVLAATGGANHARSAIGANGMAKTSKNGGSQWWFESELESTASVSSQDLFTGMADDSSAALMNTAANGIASGKLGFGFLQANGGATVDVVALRSTGTVVLKSSAVTLVAGTRHRFGMRFNGRDKIDFFVDGVKVHSHTLVAADAQSAVIGPVSVIAARTAAVRSMTLDWQMAAFRDDP